MLSLAHKAASRVSKEAVCQQLDMLRKGSLNYSTDFTLWMQAKHPIEIAVISVQGG